MFDIKGRVAIVTGSASGIGLATAKMLLEKGATVVMSDINEDLLETEFDKLYEDNYGRIAMDVTDVSNEEAVKGLIEFAVDLFGKVDILVNNAGISAYAPLMMPEANNAQMQRAFDINCMSIIYGCRYAVPYMNANGGGAVVNTASIMGLLGSPYGTPYNSSKHAVIGLTKALALEFAPHNVRVNAVAPAYVETGMANPETLGAEQWKKGLGLHPLAQALGRVGKPEEIAHAICFLIENTFMTGQTVTVDGGYTAQ